MQHAEPPYDPTELESLADYLSEQQDQILVQWQQAITNEEGKQESILSSLSQDKFYDSIPDFLEQLRENLRGKQTPLTQAAKKHGAHRWEHGLNLRNVTVEWSLLHFVIVNQVYESQESISISPTALAEAQKLLTRFVHEGIRASIEEYYRLLQEEAEGKVQVLESMVQEKEELTEQRARNLHQTSHDMKGSLTALRLNLNLLKQTDLSDQVRISQLIENLSRAANNLNEMFNNLLDLSRLEAGREEREISEFDAAELLHNLSESMRPLADSKNLELRARGEDKLKVRGDRQKVHRIAQNLLSNALKYTQQGHVEVSWELISSDQWELTIRDTGPGIDATHTKTSSDSVLTGESGTEADEKYSTQIPINGEGIGLFIVRRLCDLLDGIVDIESEADVGTTIRVIFPTDY